MRQMFEFLSKLVQINTDSTKRLNYDKITSIIKDFAENSGLQVKVETFNGIPNLIITFPGREGKELVIVTHYDVVPANPEEWDFDPFSGEIAEDKVLGREAADSKGNIVAALFAMIELLKEGITKDVSLVIVGGEEVQETRDFLKQLNGKNAIVLDAFVDYISVGSRGRGVLAFKIHGKSVHSAYAYLGKNPIDILPDVLNLIKQIEKEFQEKYKSEFLPPPNTPYDRVPITIDVTVVKAGEVENVVPENAEIVMGIRAPYPYDVGKLLSYIENKIKELVESRGYKYGRVKMIYKNGWVSKDLSFAEKIKNIYAKFGKAARICIELGGTDGSFIYQNFEGLAQFGVIRLENNIHSKNEFVYKRDVEFVKDVLKELIKSL